ncbi:RidA family protein [Bacillus sp. 2205SS5-2]|uniref:RidA family protein n=1 Tax=Bacillus sp. 2205SS5-2 TaxID=3109031 RepID=UPI00300772B8
MNKRTRVLTGSPWEHVVGYSRAIRVGNRVEVAGTTSMLNGQVVGGDDAYAQAKYILETIEDSLKKVGAEIDDVVRTRMYVTNISQWEEIGKAHGEFFRGIQPVSTMVEVSGLIDSRLLVEIEAEAIIGSE